MLQLVVAKHFYNIDHVSSGISINNTTWLRNFFKGLQWKIVIDEIFFFNTIFIYIHVSASNCRKLEKNGITFWWLNTTLNLLGDHKTV